MKTQTIYLTSKNFGASKEVKVYSWPIQPREVLDGFRSGKFKSAKDLSWHILDTPETFDKIKDTDHGDSADNNFGLRIIEQALDWSLGLAVTRFIFGLAKQKKIPKPFRIAVTKQGNIFYILNSGTVLDEPLNNVGSLISEKISDVCDEELN